MTQNVKNSWANQALSLATLTYASQLISFAALPFLTRAYIPEDYGIFAVYMSVLAVFIVFSSLRYSMAIALPKSHADAGKIFLTCLIILIGTSLLFLIFACSFYISGFKQFITHSIGLDSELVLLLPASFFLIGGSTILTSWSLRTLNARHVGIAKLFQVVTTISCQLAFGFYYGHSPLFLIIGQMLGQFFGLIILTCFCIKDTRQHLNNSFALQHLRGVVIEYKNLPKHLFQTDFLNAISKRTLPIIMVTLFNSKIVGLYTFASNIIGAPLSVITSTVWQISHARLSNLNNEERSKTLRLIHSLSCYTFAPPIIAVIIFRNELPMILGEKWAELPSIIPFVCMLIFFNSISNTSSYFVAFRKFRQESIANIMLTAIPVIAVLSGSLFLDDLETIALFCIISSLFYYLLNLYWGYTTSNVYVFTKNIGSSLAINMIAILTVKFIYDFSIICGIIFAALFLLSYYWLTVRRKFIDLKTI